MADQLTGGTDRPPSRLVPALVVLALLAIGGLALAGRGGEQPTATTGRPTAGPTVTPVAETSVPAVVGLPLADAARAVAASGLALETAYTADAQTPRGSVVAQETHARQDGGAVRLTVSEGGPVSGVGSVPPRLRRVFRDERTDVPVLLIRTHEGTAYKTDDHLLRPCAASDAAVRALVLDRELRSSCY